MCNENLKNRKLIWPENISLDFPENNNISTDINCHLDEILIHRGNKLTYQYLKSITEEDRDEIAKDLFIFFRNYDWDHICFSKKHIENDFEKLKKIQVEIPENGIIPNSSNIGNKIYKTYFPNILKISNKKNVSVYEALNDENYLWKIIRNRIGNTLLYNTKGREPRQWPMTITPSMIIQGAKCSGCASIGSIFKPVVAKTIYSQFVKDGDNIYDYSAGFGGRLLGLMSLNKNVKYFAAEPNTETYDNLLRLSRDFSFNVDIRKIGSEDLIFEEKMDFVFSSPPYFTQEIYTDEETQCYAKYPDYDDWLEQYWRKTLKNIKIMLKKDGIFAVNIGNDANSFMIKLCSDFMRIIEEEGFKLQKTYYMKTSKSHLTGKKNTNKLDKKEGIFVYGI